MHCILFLELRKCFQFTPYPRPDQHHAGRHTFCVLLCRIHVSEKLQISVHYRCAQKPQVESLFTADAQHIDTEWYLGLKRQPPHPRVSHEWWASYPVTYLVNNLLGYSRSSCMFQLLLRANPFKNIEWWFVILNASWLKKQNSPSQATHAVFFIATRWNHTHHTAHNFRNSSSERYGHQIAHFADDHAFLRLLGFFFFISILTASSYLSLISPQDYNASLTDSLVRMLRRWITEQGFTSSPVFKLRSPWVTTEANIKIQRVPVYSIARNGTIWYASGFIDTPFQSVVSYCRRVGSSFQL